jgi:hypothetical protein
MVDLLPSGSLRRSAILAEASQVTPREPVDSEHASPVDVQAEAGGQVVRVRRAGLDPRDGQIVAVVRDLVEGEVRPADVDGIDPTTDRLPVLPAEALVNRADYVRAG